jgi:hypothetical protein
MADPLFDELNLVTLKEIYPSVIEDNYFLDAPFLAYIRDHCMVPWTGGAYTQITFRYKPMIGGFYQRGASWNINKRATLAGAIFDPKFLEFAIPEYKEDLKVFNKGPLAVFKLIDEDLRNGMDSASALTAIAMARHGRPIVTGISDDRTGKLNGWIEAMNDGATQGWDGNYFTTYGGATRGGVIGSVMNSVPVFCGNASGGAGPISYNLLEEAYQDACVGKEAPNLMVSNKAGIAYVKERMQVQQIFQQEKDPIWGVTGFRFNNAMVLKDDYFPSLKYGKNDPDLGNYLTSTFTSGTTMDAASNLPASQTITVGEVIAMFNTKKWIFRVADDDEYGYGFTGWYPAQDNSKVVGHIKAAVMLECTAPRLQKQLYGING